MGADGDAQALQDLLLELLPVDGSALGNARLFLLLQAEAAGRGLRCGEAQFAAVREALVAAGQASEGPRRGGSTARAPAAKDKPEAADGAAAARPDFELQGEVVPAELPFDEPKPRRAAARPSVPRPASHRC